MKQLKDLSNHHINVLVEHHVFDWQVRQIGRDGAGESHWVCDGPRGPYAIREWSESPDLAAAVLERYSRRGIKLNGSNPREVCLDALKTEGVG